MPLASLPLSSNTGYGWIMHCIVIKACGFFLVGFGYSSFPLLYFGIGPDTNGEELAQIDAGSISIRERVLRKIHGSLYLGFETDFQRLSNVGLTRLTENPFGDSFGSDEICQFGDRSWASV